MNPNPYLPGGTVYGNPERVPVRFNHKSELIRQVQSGKNALNFPLSSQGAVIQPDRIRG